MTFFLKAIVWIILACVFAAIGLATDNPGTMVPVYGFGFLILIGILLFYLSRKKRQSYESMETPAYVPFLIGGILLLIAIVFPTFTIQWSRPNYGLGFGTLLTFTIVMVGLGSAGVWLINVLGTKNIAFSIVGFLVLIGVSAIPALAIASLDTSFDTMGVLYFTTMIEAVLVWTGFTTIYHKLKPED